MSLTYTPRQTVVNGSGRPYAGARAWFYRAGTTTAQTVYSDAALATPHTNPVVANAAGRFPIIYLDPDNDYRCIVKDSGGNTLFDDDAIPSTVLTADGVGRAIYPRTAGEITAAVTPTNYAYPPGDVRRYGTNASPGETDMTDAINNALASNNSVYAPKGIYKVTSSILVNSFNELYGDGWGANGSDGGTVFLATTDIEIIASANTDTESLPYVYLHDFVAQSTVSDGTTKYQIHLRNMNQTHIERVKTVSGLADTDYSTTNLAGIWLDDTIAGEGAYINRVAGCFIQNGGLLIDDAVTDGTIIDNFIYGHCCPHSLKFNSAGGNWTVSGNNLTSPPSGAAIEIAGGNISAIRIIGNFFDGNPTALDSGVGILVTSAPRVQIIGNTIWAMGKNGIRAVDPVGLIVQGNIFLNCNDEDDGYADVAIVGDTFQPSTNIVSGNWFQQEASRTTKGYAIEEQNDGFSPVQNVYTGNQISSNYLTTGSYGGIQTLEVGAQAAKVAGNSGGSTDTETFTTQALTLTGCTTTPTATSRITRQGKFVEVYVPAVSATSNTTACTLTGIPAAYRPTNTARGFAFVTNNGADAFGAWAVDSTGTITLYYNNSATGFTNSGTKGIPDGLTLLYPLT
jgi:hypothetical protein